MRRFLAVPFIALVVFVVWIGQLPPGLKNPEHEYLFGKLPTCDGGVINKGVADVVEMLDEADTQNMRDYMSAKGIPSIPTDKVLFVHEMPKPDYAPDALFTYFLITHDDKQTDESTICVIGGLNGSLPFNERLYKKYHRVPSGLP